MTREVDRGVATANGWVVFKEEDAVDKVMCPFYLVLSRIVSFNNAVKPFAAF